MSALLYGIVMTSLPYLMIKHASIADSKPRDQEQTTLELPQGRNALGEVAKGEGVEDQEAINYEASNNYVTVVVTVAVSLALRVCEAHAKQALFRTRVLCQNTSCGF